MLPRPPCRFHHALLVVLTTALGSCTWLSAGDDEASGGGWFFSKETLPVAWEVRPVVVTSGHQAQAELWLRVPDGVEVNADSLAVTGERGAQVGIGTVHVPPVPAGQEGLAGDVKVAVDLDCRSTAPGLHEIPVTLTARGCAKGRCYAERNDEVSLLVHVQGDGSAVAP